jgi:hypothetical protein
MKLPTSQKGFAPVLLLLGIAILIFVGVGGTYLYNQTKQRSQSSYSSNSQSNQTQQENVPQELSKLPIYPGSKLIKQEKMPDCSTIDESEREKSMWERYCDATEYISTSDEKTESVIDWYENDRSGSGWKIGGGAGEKGIERFGSLWNGEKTYWIYIGGAEDNKTQIKIRIQNTDGEIMMQKYKIAYHINPDTASLEVSVKKIEENYARGTFINKLSNEETEKEGLPGHAGLWWIAQKQDKDWKLILEGNGFPTCSELDKYQVPSSISDCVEAGGKLRSEM